MSSLLVQLQRHFGHSSFRPGQERVIESLLAGRSALAIFPTGAGKSLCYQLPALLLPGLTLVISPLIALMKDQVETLQARGIQAARLDSTLTAAEVASVFDAMQSGALKLLYVAPERLMNENFMRRLERTQVSLLAIDESHCISEWGHNFRPDYLRLAEISKRLKLRPVLALTATATPEVAADTRALYGFQVPRQGRLETLRRLGPPAQVSVSFRLKKLGFALEALAFLGVLLGGMACARRPAAQKLLLLAGAGFGALLLTGLLGAANAQVALAAMLAAGLLALLWVSVILWSALAAWRRKAPPNPRAGGGAATPGGPAVQSGPTSQTGQTRPTGPPPSAPTTTENPPPPVP